MCEANRYWDRADPRSVTEQLEEQQRRQQLARWIQEDDGKQPDQLMAGVLWLKDILSRESSHKPNGKPFRGRMPTCLAVHLARHGFGSSQFAVKPRVAIFQDGTVFEVVSKSGTPLRLGGILVKPTESSHCA